MKRRGKALFAVAALFAFLVFVTTALAETPAGSCPNEEMRTGKSVQLPECRAYEQVSPRDKEYGVFNGQPFLAISSDEGGAVAFTTNGPLPGSASGSLMNAYLSQRGAEGWSLTPLTPPQTPIPGSTTYPYIQGFSSDLTRNAVVTANPTLAPGAEPNIANLYVRETGPETWRLITTPQEGLYEGSLRYTFKLAGASSDFSHVVIQSNEPLLPGVSGFNNLYENFNGEFRNVGVLPNGENAPGAGFPGSISNRGFHALSEDGSRIYFYSDNHLYLREDASTTVDATPSQRTVPDPHAYFESPPTFWAATSDGAKMFFTTNMALTDDANTGTDSEGNPADAGANLYMFDAESEELTDLTVDTNPGDEAGADVQGVVGSSDDGAYVYFVARGELAEGATSGADNLYLWHNGTVTFLAALSSADEGNWAIFIPSITSRVTPDGRHVLLSSSTPLTEYDNTDAGTSLPDTELYVYSAVTGEFTCASCRPDGSAPEASTTVTSQGNPLEGNGYPPGRYITDDGRTVAFDTTEPLVPQDTNGQRDVYAYSEGEVHLISTGTSEFETRFGDISPDGTDIFIGTQEQLLPSDEDGYADLYDARAGGGYLPPPPPIPPCSGGECVRNSSSPPASPVLGSSTFSGAGNVKARHRKRCGKHARLVHRHGKTRCVKKHRKHHRGGSK